MDGSYHLWRFFAIKTFQMSATVKFKESLYVILYQLPIVT